MKTIILNDSEVETLKELIEVGLEYVHERKSAFKATTAVYELMTNLIDESGFQQDKTVSG